MKFEYNRPKTTVEAYGTTYEIPPKTAAVVDGVDAARKAIAASASKPAAEQIKAVKQGIAVFIGEEETERLFPADSDIDTDEISEFWLLLNHLSNEHTNKIIERYSPKGTKDISVTKRPKN